MFESFCGEIKTQFHTFVQVLLSDNAPEYFSIPSTTFISSQGILHQSSCAYTPQQNGVVERKNRHLIEIACTLLLHHHVPFCFWVNAILIACYLINKMPSLVLQHQIPHSLLFPDQPLYIFPPRVFGCTTLSITCLPIKINCLLGPSSAFFLVTLAFRRVIGVILLTPAAIFFRWMLPSLSRLLFTLRLIPSVNPFLRQSLFPQVLLLLFFLFLLLPHCKFIIGVISLGLLPMEMLFLRLLPYLLLLR